jgi:hypothetical protein
MEIFKQIVVGVNYIHSQGLIHRDLKVSITCFVIAFELIVFLIYQLFESSTTTMAVFCCWMIHFSLCFFSPAIFSCIATNDLMVRTNIVWRSETSVSLAQIYSDKIPLMVLSLPRWSNLSRHYFLQVIALFYYFGFSFHCDVIFIKILYLFDGGKNGSITDNYWTVQ